MNNITRILAGISGGFAASASKILALDVQQLADYMNTGNLTDFNELKVTIFVFTPILMALGGIIAWASQETSRIKALAIGCAAPALIVPWTSGKLSTIPVNQASIVSSAYAQSTAQSQSDGSYLKGLRGLLGIENPNDKKYWVIVGSKKKIEDAKSFADAINGKNPELKAFVGQKQPDNEYYPIIIGGTESYLQLGQAKALKERAQNVDIIPGDSYLSAFPDRLPAVE